jgi:hypothetical protein
VSLAPIRLIQSQLRTGGRGHARTPGSYGLGRMFAIDPRSYISYSAGRKGAGQQILLTNTRTLGSHGNDLRSFDLTRIPVGGWTLAETGWKTRWGIEEYLTDKLIVATTRVAEAIVLAAVASGRRLTEPLPPVEIVQHSEAFGSSERGFVDDHGQLVTLDFSSA